MPKSADKRRPRRAGPGVRDISGNLVEADATEVGMLSFNGKSAVTELGPRIREHLGLSTSGPVTLTADQFDHLLVDVTGAGWHNAVRQINHWLGEVSGGAITIGEAGPVDDAGEPADDPIGEPQSNA